MKLKRIIRILILIPLLILICSISYSDAPENLIKNGGFEEKMEGWSTYGDVKTSVETKLAGATIKDEPIEGKRALFISIAAPGENFWSSGLQHKDHTFEKGKKYLKPMVLKDVAKKINMHESTVSRVTSNKLILTPRGILDMKIFFSASINSLTECESHSAASVRESLKKLISSEPINNPLSDEALVFKLQHEGINLARRTVAKYRELLNIPSSSTRRRMMKIQNLNM